MLTRSCFIRHKFPLKDYMFPLGPSPCRRLSRPQSTTPSQPPHTRSGFTFRLDSIRLLTELRYGASQVPNATLLTCHSLIRPRWTFYLPRLNGRRNIGFGTLNTLAVHDAFSRLYQLSPSAFSITACKFPCVRFVCLVRLLSRLISKVGFDLRPPMSLCAGSTLSLSVVRLRHTRNTRYWLLAKHHQIGTFTR